MSIPKKSLISTLKTAKKANVAASAHEADVKGEKVASMRVATAKSGMHAKGTPVGTLKLAYRSFKSFKSAKNATTLKSVQ